jgi:hypothetical protein
MKGRFNILPRLFTTIGADPEVFFQQDGAIVGSELVIPKEGLGPKTGYEDQVKPLVIRDGIQVEFNPTAATDAHTFVANVASCFTCLAKHLKEVHKDAYILSWQELVRIPRKTLASLSKESRTLGCAPSLNVYTGPQVLRARSGYPVRTAGGHIHIGLQAVSSTFSERSKLILLSELLIGLITVMLDLDEAQVERRTVYGKAGEYRLQSYGVEYRVPSNFWLRHPILTEFMFKQAQLTAAVYTQSISQSIGYMEELIEKVDFDKVREAINNSNPELAWELYATHIVPFICNYVPEGLQTQFPLRKSNLSKFHKLLEAGINEVFKGDPMDLWTKGKFEKNSWETVLDKF